MSELQITLLGLAFLITAPLSLGACVFTWVLHHDDRRADTRQPKPLIRLSLVMAVTSTLAAAAALFLAIVSGLRLGLLDFALDRSTAREIVSDATFWLLAALELLNLIPIVNAGYLAWIRRDRD